MSVPLPASRANTTSRRCSRRTFLGFSAASIGSASVRRLTAHEDSNEPPNILLCISDDQSWLNTSAMGDPTVRTPAFDRVAEEGVLFTNAYCDAPTCGPSRSAILTGQPIWRIVWPNQP